MNTYSLAREYPSSELNWLHQYKNSITSIESLCKELEIHANQLPFSVPAHQQFHLRVTKSYIQRMQKSNPHDPLLLQVLPHVHEENKVLGYYTDPVGDLESCKSPGLIKKYNGRALLLTTSRCAVHCRYCFRRHFPYTLHNPRKDDWHLAINKINSDTSIEEVILSGGDPLVLPEENLVKIFKQLETIDHVKRLRIHTRLPVVIPDRINNNFLQLINNTNLQIIIVLHLNHYQELDCYLKNKLRELSSAKCILLNQSVLLKNINDNVNTLTKLSEALIEATVLPYYLHILDKVQGAAHFNVTEEQARKIMSTVATKLPGYLVPRLVKEQSGHPAKTLIAFKAAR